MSLYSFWSISICYSYDTEVMYFNFLIKKKTLAPVIKWKEDTDKVFINPVFLERNLIVSVKVKKKKKVFKKLLLPGVVIPSLGVYPKETSMLSRYMYTDVHHSIIYNSKKKKNLENFSKKTKTVFFRNK